MWTKPSSYSLNFAAALSGVAGGGPAAQARRLEDAVDVVPVEVRQEVGDDEGEVVEREAGGAAQLADHGALLLARLPGQPARAAGAVPAALGPAPAPLADGLGADAVAPASTPSARRAGDLGAHGRGGAGVRVDREHQAAPLRRRRVRLTPSKRQAYDPTAQRA
jgi:hypothetical protein